jgi:adenosine deaminase CECR1
MKLPSLVAYALCLSLTAAKVIPDDVPDPNGSAVKRHLMARKAMITIEKRQRQDMPRPFLTVTMDTDWP